MVKDNEAQTGLHAFFSMENKKLKKMKKIYFISLVLLVALASCKNQEWDFPDYKYTTVYFAYQYPVRTITLGEDIFDNTLDNEHKCEIMATTGGVYENKKDIIIDVTVDNSLSNGLLFGQGGDQIIPMPGNYYNLASNQIVIPKGQLSGGVVVELTDAFFADTLALKKTYVIPMYMTQVVNADSILSGTPLVNNPNRCVATDWSVVPKDYILYAIKYINSWHGYYLRRGTDVLTGKNGNTSLDTTIVRHQHYVENDAVFQLTTRSLTKTVYPLIIKDSQGHNVDCTLILTFDDAGKCTVSSNTSNCTATGNGQFVKKGEKNSWGNTDRDAIYLNYEVDLSEMHVATKDTLVSRNRGVVMETFSPLPK